MQTLGCYVFLRVLASWCLLVRVLVFVWGGLPVLWIFGGSALCGLCRRLDRFGDSTRFGAG